MHSIYINNLGVKIKLLEENAGEHLCNSRRGKALLCMAKTRNMKKKVYFNKTNTKDTVSQADLQRTSGKN